MTATNRPTKISSHKNETTYRLGAWLITVERKSKKTYSCGTSRSSSWSQWSAINMETLTAADSKSGTGGIKEAALKLSAI